MAGLMIADDFQIIRDDLRSGLEEEGFEIVSGAHVGQRISVVQA